MNEMQFAFILCIFVVFLTGASTTHDCPAVGREWCDIVVCMLRL